ncbi:MAG TPA: bifunctional phosphoglucose/phosphomannose isomerase [Candidatus Omnitrophota bacterium]|nr:bifunctional phosphoglucose/phosphomannose isomerase [Candidatus Omnitrophota bacterium]
MISLDDKDKLKGIDKSGMLEVVLSTPQMLREALQVSGSVAVKAQKSPNKIIVAGMGGSAAAGDLLADLLRDGLKVPLLVNRNYTIPGYLDPDTLVFISSYSGDTEETLYCLKEAEKAQARIVCVASDGKIKSQAEEKKYPLFEMKQGLQPRAALPYSLTAIGVYLEKAGLIEKFSEQAKETADVLDQLKQAFGPEVGERQNPVKQITKKLQGKMPVIFAATGTTEAIGRRFKNQLNENSKMNAHLSVFPELNHNELVSLSELKRGEHNLAAVFLRDEEDLARINKRIEITRSTLGARMGGALEIPFSGKSRLARMFSQIYFIDLLSVYLAILDGIDPTPVDAISKFKKEMQR